MKKAFMMMFALLALPMAMQAQVKYHDVELNEATGPVKSITQDVMGNLQTTLFTEEGKMQREGISDVLYDGDGYLRSYKMEVQGMEMSVTYKWENGKVVSQTMDMGGQGFTITRTYNEKGATATESMNFGGNEMVTPYTDYKYDDHGNWISRKGSMMGQEMEQTRTITYYE
ncbi:MAG: hypothetical protein IKX22_12840 [Prevotella sp.]|nr:hypothetical protein [Prevotella sp.]